MTAVRSMFMPPVLVPITLVSLDEHFREEYEPHAATLQSRLASLRYLHDHGCQTWVSVEPYPTPNIIEQELLPLLESISFVDKIIFGRLNYNKLATEYKEHKKFYNTCAETVIHFCEAQHIAYHIKDGTITK